MTIDGIGASDWAAMLGALATILILSKLCLILQRIYDQQAWETKQRRRWRKRMTKSQDQPFHYHRLTPFERTWLNADGQTSEQWMRACAAEFIAHRRGNMPTCADYLNEFGTRPKMRPAETRTLVRH